MQCYPYIICIAPPPRTWNKPLLFCTVAKERFPTQIWHVILLACLIFAYFLQFLSYLILPKIYV